MNPDDLAKLLAALGLTPADASSTRLPADIRRAQAAAHSRTIGRADHGNIPVPTEILKALPEKRVTKIDKVIGAASDLTPIAGVKSIVRAYHLGRGGDQAGATRELLNAELALAPFLKGGKLPVSSGVRVGENAAKNLAHVAEAETSPFWHDAHIPTVAADSAAKKLAVRIVRSEEPDGSVLYTAHHPTRLDQAGGPAYVGHIYVRDGSVEDAHVPTELRRQGIATALYNYAENDLGRRLRPSKALTADGQAFWDNRRANAPRIETESPFRASWKVRPDSVAARGARLTLLHETPESSVVGNGRQAVYDVGGQRVHVTYGLDAERPGELYLDGINGTDTDHKRVAIGPAAVRQIYRDLIARTGAKTIVAERASGANPDRFVEWEARRLAGRDVATDSVVARIPETLTGVAMQHRGSGKVYQIPGFDGGHGAVWEVVQKERGPLNWADRENLFSDGFITSNGRYVGRDEALDIAKARHQWNGQNRAKLEPSGRPGLHTEAVATDSVASRGAREFGQLLGDANNATSRFKQTASEIRAFPDTRRNELIEALRNPEPAPRTSIAPRGHPEIQGVLRELQQASGSPNLPRVTAIDPEKGKMLARAYERLPKNDPNAKSAYDALNREVAAQKKRLEDAGFRFEFVDEDPYKNSKEMMADVAQNRRLKVLKTPRNTEVLHKPAIKTPDGHIYTGPSHLTAALEAGFAYGDVPKGTVDGWITESGKFIQHDFDSSYFNPRNPAEVEVPGENFHPYMTPEQNDDFRAVHDLLAHAGEGHQFGPVGEENAFRVHASTLSPEALPALASETRGQNSWVNFGPNAHLPVRERPFAEQKAALFPAHLTGDYGAMVEPTVFEHYSPKTGLTSLDPKFMGTGLTGAERARPSRIPTTHVYVAGTKPERQFANLNKYNVHVTGDIYDLGKDPNGILPALQKKIASGTLSRSAGDELERMIKKAGFAGYNNADYPNTVKLFAAHPMTPAGDVAPAVEDWASSHIPPASTSLPPQVDLRRHIGPRINPQRLDDIRTETFNTLMSRQWEQMLREGKFPDWYRTGGTKQKAIDALGDEEGPLAFKRLRDIISAVTARSEPANNLRRGGYYRALDLAGLLDPDALRAGLYKRVPEGMGHFAASTQQNALARLVEEGALNPITNPKPASFAENLGENFRPYTNDSRMATGKAMFNPRLLDLGAIIKNESSNGVNFSPRDWAYQPMEQAAQDAAQHYAGRGLFDVPTGADPTAFLQAQGWDALGTRIPGSSRSQGTFDDIFNAKLAANANAWGVSEPEANALFWAGHPFDLPLKTNLIPRGLLKGLLKP